MSEVKEAYVSYGVYDLIIKVQAEKLDELKTTITNKIRTLKNVSSTLSLITVEE
jgi:DNA-binding Lrp family transcriptional regulator